MAHPSFPTTPWKTAKYYRRVAWLKTHPQLAEIPTVDQDVTPEQSLLIELLAKDMVASGLFSKKTALRDVKWGIRLAAGEARA